MKRTSLSIGWSPGVEVTGGKTRGVTSSKFYANFIVAALLHSQFEHAAEIGAPLGKDMLVGSHRLIPYEERDAGKMLV